MLYRAAAAVARATLKAGAATRGRRVLWRLTGPLVRARAQLGSYHAFRMPGEFTVNVLGQPMRLTGTPWSGIAAGVYWGGAEGFEPVETKLLASLAPCYTNAMDIGANIGWFTLVLLRHNPRLRVDAFEPNPAVANILEQNLSLNGLTAHVNRTAVASSEGDATFYVDADDWASSLTAQTQQATTIRVNVTTVDEYVDRHRLRPDLMKIDVEGNELDVLRGATQTLMTCSPDLVFEITPRLTRVASIRNLLHEAGYAGIWAFDQTMTLVEDRAFLKCDGRNVINYFSSRHRCPPRTLCHSVDRAVSVPA